MRIKTFRQFNESSDVRTPSTKEIAKKHKVSTSYVKKQEEEGAKIEKEHTKSEKKAKEIARDHMKEFKGYYPALKKMEAKLKKKEGK